MKHLALLISLIIFKSCGSSQDVAKIANTTSMNTNQTISGSYTLERLNTTDLTEELTLEFDSQTNKVSGFAGCNRFNGNYSVTDNMISFSELVSTKMHCQDEVNKIERNLFQTLAKVNSFEIINGKLSLRNNESILIQANESLMSKSRQSKDDLNISYRASTRGFFEMIWIEGRVLKHTNDRDLKDINEYELNDKQLSELNTLYNELNLEAIPSLEAPSKTHQYDAAPFATLEIKEGDKSFKSNGFDHGNPPKPIFKFVDKVLSIKEIMIKQ